MAVHESKHQEAVIKWSQQARIRAQGAGRTYRGGPAARHPV